MSKRKSKDVSNNPNADLCEFLTELSNYERNVERNIYKSNAYRKASNTLADLPKRVESGEEAKKLPGIGDKIGKKIDEFLTTGKLRKLEDINKDEKTTAINLLTRVSGIGPAKAKELADQNIKTLEDLKNHSDKLNRHQKLGLKYYDDFEKKIPREEIVEIEKIIKRLISELSKDYIVTICGSYRRGEEQSGDIDALITHPNFNTTILKTVVQYLEKKKFIRDTISLGSSKFMGVCCLNEINIFRRLDIRVVPQEQYHCAILYFTGSDLFNKNIRSHALNKKYTLNEYSLKRLTPEGCPGEAEIITCEEDIFEILGLPYKEPNCRV